MSKKQGLALLLMAITLAGCGPSSEEVTDDYRSSESVPEGLKDCRFFRMKMTLIVRCPRSDTSVIDTSQRGHHSALLED